MSDDTPNRLPHVRAERRGWRGRWLTWGMVGLFALLLVGIPATIYLFNQVRGRAMLRREIDEIVKSGEPFTSAELNAWHKLPPGTTDLTTQWQAAMAPFWGPPFRQAFGQLPILNRDPAPPIGQRWPDEQLVARFLQKHGGDLNRLHALAKKEGEVRYPRAMEHGMWAGLPETESAQPAHKALRVEFHRLLRDGRTHDAFDNLHTQFALSNTFAHDPFLISLIIRAKNMDAESFKDVRALLAHAELADEQLAELQRLIRSLDYERHMTDGLVSDRGMIYHAFYYGFTENRGFSDGTNWATIAGSTTDTSLILQPEDCAMSMKFSTEMVEASKKPLPEAMKELDAIGQEIAALNDDSQINAVRYYRTRMFLPRTAQWLKAVGEVAGQRDALDVELAEMRYRKKHGKPAENVEVLVPEFLPRVPVDAMTGKRVELNGK